MAICPQQYNVCSIDLAVQSEGLRGMMNNSLNLKKDSRLLRTNSEFLLESNFEVQVLEYFHVLL